MRNARRTLGLGLAFLVVALWGDGAQAASRRATPRRSEPRRTHSAASRSKPEAPRHGGPLTVAFTVLPGDTHERLSVDLTGSDDKKAALRRIDAKLDPGERIRVPADLLLPELADSRRETVVFGDRYPTLWSVARTTGARSALELSRTARNLQRLNAILDADRVSPGRKLLVPKGLLGPAEDLARKAVPKKQEVKADEPGEGRSGEAAEQRSLEVLSRYRARDLDALERRWARLPSRLRLLLSEKEFEEAHHGRGEVNLVVVHTTEHRGSTFENTASYIQRKRLANYLVGPEGAVYEVVPEEYRAFGCGDSLWDGKYVVDLEAINIEIFANTDKGDLQDGISEAQYEGLRALLADIQRRRPKIDEGRIVTHRMVALNYKTGTRSRKGDPYEFAWEKAGMPDNSKVPDRDMLDGRAKLCTDCRFSDRVTTGQAEAAKIMKKL